MAKLIAHNPPRAQLKSSGYIGEPTGDIELTENHTTYNVKAFATATTNIPDPVLIEKTVTANGEYSASEDGVDGYSQVTVTVPATLPIDSESLLPFEMGLDTGGFFVTDIQGGGTAFGFGRDLTGIYVREATNG